MFAWTGTRSGTGLRRVFRWPSEVKCDPCRAEKGWAQDKPSLFVYLPSEISGQTGSGLHYRAHLTGTTRQCSGYPTSSSLLPQLPQPQPTYLVVDIKHCTQNKICLHSPQPLTSVFLSPFPFTSLPSLPSLPFSLTTPCSQLFTTCGLQIEHQSKIAALVSVARHAQGLAKPKQVRFAKSPCLIRTHQGTTRFAFHLPSANNALSFCTFTHLLWTTRAIPRCRSTADRSAMRLIAQTTPSQMLITSTTPLLARTSHHRVATSPLEAAQALF